MLSELDELPRLVARDINRFKSFMNAVGKRISCLAVAVLVGLVVGCDREPAPRSGKVARQQLIPRSEQEASAEAAAKRERQKELDAMGAREFLVRGVIQEIKRGGEIAIIDHEEIPGYMKRMIMPFRAKDPAEFADRKPNDRVSFRMMVTELECWVDRVTKIGEGPVDLKAERREFRLVRDVQPLEIGDRIPNYPMTNELGRAVQLHDFKGKAVALTFIFTRCPMPDFCPRMTRQFDEAYKALLSDQAGPDNWHLLSISFDVDHDTPDVLKGYSRVHDCDPDRWSFLTGKLIEIDAISEQFGMMFARETEGGFIYSHNLRTAVLDTNGRVQKIFVGYEWTSAELVEAIREAAAVPVESGTDSGSKARRPL